MTPERLLFVYGTLRPSLAPAALVPVLSGLRSCGRATVAGRLFDFGAWPAAVLDAACDAPGPVIVGELLALPDDDAWRVLDDYEGFVPARPGESLFQRAETEAALEDGRRVRCWIYVYARDPGTAPVLAGGDWARRDEERGRRALTASCPAAGDRRR